MRYHNPVLQGFHPDPSICRVGEDFYMATSSFTYWPGVPVFHSKNLTDWSLVGHCLTRENQICLEDRHNSRGIFAPTLRYHEGIFYMITTDVDGIGNFIVHSISIDGSWSAPVVINQDGIDPSLFWDEDGTCWYCGKGRLDGERGIVAFTLDPLTGEILSDKYIISKGCGGKCAEGPHIYKRDGWYYLLTAEGGTQYSHRAVIQRSRNIISGYEPCPYNPILSHQEENWRVIQAVGHGDLVQDQTGNWWSVCLGIRMFGDYLLHNLGRETFLVPVVWRDGWPVMGKEGRVEMVMDGPSVTEENKNETGELKNEIENIIRKKWKLDFEADRMPRDLWYIRNMHPYSYEMGGGRLVLRGNDIELDSATGSPTCILREQREFVMEMHSCLDLKDCEQGRFGMTVYYSNYNHYDIAVVKNKEECILTLYKHIYDLGAVTKEISLAWERRKLWLRIRTDRAGYYFDYSLNHVEWIELGQGVIAGLCTEAMMERSYTGAMMGLFAEHGTGVFEDGLLIMSQRREEEMIHGISR